MKRDSFVSNILTISIAILFPIVAYYFASIIISDAELSSRTSRYLSSYSQRSEGVIVTRSAIACILALIAIIQSMAALRPHKELFRGLIGGSLVIIMISNIYIAGISYDENKAYAFIIQWMSFILLYGLIHYASRNLPQIVLKQSNEDKISSPFENQPQQENNKVEVYPDLTPPTPPQAPQDESENKENETNNES